MSGTEQYADEVRQAIGAFGFSDEAKAGGKLGVDVDGLIADGQTRKQAAAQTAVAICRKLQQAAGSGNSPLPKLDRGPDGGYRIAATVISPRLKFDDTAIYLDGERVRTAERLFEAPKQDLARLLELAGGMPAWALAEKYGLADEAKPAGPRR